ncbi:hypothetical protein Emed_000214 [Eimeria media]
MITNLAYVEERSAFNQSPLGSRMADTAFAAYMFLSSAPCLDSGVNTESHCQQQRRHSHFHSQAAAIRGAAAIGRCPRGAAANLEPLFSKEELERIRDVVERYPYIALDTEFPGIVARPTSNALDYNYRTVKYNVDLLKVIQLGLTFADSRGRLAEGTCTWQFNFRFDLNEDMYAQNSIDFLKQSGIDFDKQQKKGVEVHDFGELIMNSGLVMNEDVKWISFHGCYDFGYLLKLLTCEALPESENAFFELVQDFFPSLYDIKFLLRDLPTFNLSQGSSLQKVSEQLNVQRVGPQHQAGSDSLVTCRTFFNLVESYFDGKIDEAKFSGVIYGLGATAHKPHRGPPGGGGLSSPPAQDLGGGGGSGLLLHNNDGKQQQDGSSSSELMLGGPGAMSRYVSAGPGSRLGGQHHHHSQQQQQGPWGSVGRVGGGVVSIRQQQHSQQALLGMPGSGGAAAAAPADSSNPLMAGTPDRLRGSPGSTAAHHSGALLPGGGAAGAGASTRGFGTELHRTGSAPPAPLLCSSGEGRVWPAPGSSLAVGGSRPANAGQQHQSDAAAAPGAFVLGAGGAAAALVLLLLLLRYAGDGCSKLSAAALGTPAGRAPFRPLLLQHTLHKRDGVVVSSSISCSNGSSSRFVVVCISRPHAVAALGWGGPRGALPRGGPLGALRRGPLGAPRRGLGRGWVSRRVGGVTHRLVDRMEVHSE